MVLVRYRKSLGDIQMLIKFKNTYDFVLMPHKSAGFSNYKKKD